MDKKNKKKFHILLVEDNEGDIVLTLEALGEIKLEKTISVARDGEEALAYLNKEGNFEDAVSPNLILLDINLPRVDGKEVLKYIKTHPVLKKIPVIVLTTSHSQTDINESYSSYANYYVTKPVDLESFFALAKSVEEHWLSVVKFPSI